MESLSDELLIQTFYRAKSLSLPPEFIQALKAEIIRRNLRVDLTKCDTE